MADVVVRPIGSVSNVRIAVEDDNWGQVRSTIALDQDELEPDATVGLESFSHVEVVYLFDRVDPATVCRGSRHPRGREDWPRVGILAQRAKDRPNRIGITVCKLLGAEGLAIEVEGLDAVDGTPVLDVKPWMDEFGARGMTSQPDWATDLMRSYWEAQAPN